MRESKQIDLLSRGPNGEIVTAEVAGNAEHEIHSALFCLQVQSVRKHIVVALDKKILSAVKEKFSEFSLLIDEERVEILTLTEALSESWSPLES